MSFVKDVVKGAVGIGGAFGKDQTIDAPRPTGLTTPTFALNLGSGTLARGTGTAASLVPRTEAGAIGSLQANRAQLGGIRDVLGSLRGSLDPLQQRTSGFFDTTAGLRNRLTGQLDELRPGFGRLTESRVQGIRSAASKASGNLRSNFAQRNVGGASFANAQIASVAQDFANEEDRVRAESFLEEQQAQQQLIQQVGEIMKFDAGNVGLQMQQIGLAAGLTAQDASVLAQEVQTIQAEAGVAAQRAQRELTELGYSGQLVAAFTKIGTDLAIAEAQFKAKQQFARGKSLELGANSLVDAGIGGFNFAQSFGGGGGGQTFTNFENQRGDF